jgi:hypothetical protein
MNIFTEGKVIIENMINIQTLSDETMADHFIQDLLLLLTGHPYSVCVTEVFDVKDNRKGKQIWQIDNSQIFSDVCDRILRFDFQYRDYRVD